MEREARSCADGRDRSGRSAGPAAFAAATGSHGGDTHGPRGARRATGPLDRLEPDVRTGTDRRRGSPRDAETRGCAGRPREGTGLDGAADGDTRRFLELAPGEDGGVPGDRCPLGRPRQLPVGED